MALLIENSCQDSSEPPHTTSEDEIDSPNTTKRKKLRIERQLRYQRDKERKLRIKNDMKLIKDKYKAPFNHIWAQIPSIKFDNNGKFWVNCTELSRNILNVYTIVDDLGNFKYKLKYQYVTSYNTSIGYPTNSKIFYGSASMKTPKYSYNFSEEVQQEMCSDMISNLYRYDKIKNKNNKKLKVYTTWCILC